MTKWERLRDTAKAYRDEVASILDDEKCDHSVGICWCEYRRLAENLDEYIVLCSNKEPSEVHHG